MCGEAPLFFVYRGKSAPSIFSSHSPLISLHTHSLTLLFLSRSLDLGRPAQASAFFSSLVFSIKEVVASFMWPYSTKRLITLSPGDICLFTFFRNCSIQLN